MFQNYNNVETGFSGVLALKCFWMSLIFFQQTYVVVVVVVFFFFCFEFVEHASFFVIFKKQFYGNQS